MQSDYPNTASTAEPDSATNCYKVRSTYEIRTYWAVGMAAAVGVPCRADPGGTARDADRLPSRPFFRSAMQKNRKLLGNNLGSSPGYGKGALRKFLSFLLLLSLFFLFSHLRQASRTVAGWQLRLLLYSVSTTVSLKPCSLPSFRVCISHLSSLLA